MAEKHFVVQGAQCSCQFGASPDQLEVAANDREYINDGDGSSKPIASTKDIGQPFSSKTFGKCSITRSSCSPAVTQWQGFYQQVTLTNGGKILTEESKAVCSVSGSPCISINFHGQTAAVSSAHFNNVEVETMALLNPAAPKPGNKQEIPQVKQIKVKDVSSAAKKEAPVPVVKVRVDEQLKFEVVSYYNGSKADTSKVGWKVFNTAGFGAPAQIFEETGPTLSLNFDAPGSYRVMAFGSEGNDTRCSLDITVANNKLKNELSMGSDVSRLLNKEYRVRRGVPVTVSAVYEMTPATAEEKQLVSMTVTDGAGNVVAGPTAPGTDKITFTPANTASSYRVTATMEGEQPQVVTRDMVSEANGVVKVTNDQQADKVRPRTTMTFKAAEMVYKTQLQDFEASAIKWQLNGKDVGTGSSITLDGNTYFSNPGSYVVEAYVVKADAWDAKKGMPSSRDQADDWRFEVKQNEIVKIMVKDGSDKWTVGKRYTLEAKTLMAYQADLDGPISWEPGGKGSGTTIGGIYASGRGKVKITARLGNSAQMLVVDANYAEVSKWCFTDKEQVYKSKAGWGETLKAVIKSTAAAGEKVNIHILEQDGADNFNYIKDLGEVTFDAQGIAALDVKTDDLKAKLSALYFEGKYYDVLFAVLQRPGDIVFADMKTVKCDGKLFWFPQKERNLRDKETGKLVYINKEPEVVAVHYYDSTKYPAYKVYPYGEKLRIHIQTRNLANKELIFQLWENRLKLEDKLVQNSKVKVLADETVELDLDTGRLKSADNKGLRSFYVVLKTSEKEQFMYPETIADKNAFDPKDVSYYQHVKLSDAAAGMNDANRNLAPTVLGEALEGGPVSCKGKYCIKLNDKGKLVQELNIRLMGFGGTIPEETFTARTEKAVRQFQQDYMEIAPTGKVCGNTLKALDEFCEKYTEQIKNYICLCNGVSRIKDKCDGFGKGQFKGEHSDPQHPSEKNHKYEYPGIHRSLLWGVSAAKFYAEKKSVYTFDYISAGYRCWAHNNYKGRTSTNHMGKAVDIHYKKNGKATSSSADMEKIRTDVFIKYNGAQLGWDGANRFSLERTSDGATTWVHVDVRRFDSVYLEDKFFVKTQAEILGKKIMDLAREEGFSNTCACMGEAKKVKNENIVCTTCTVFEKARKDFYEEFGEQALHFIETSTTANKFKALYMVAQRREENGFNLMPPGNNPMNIKGQGDDGQVLLTTKEDYGKGLETVKDNFAKFTTVEKGFEGYRNLLQRNYPDAYTALTSDDKTIDDYVKGLQDTGRLGSYATLADYKEKVTTIFNGVVKDYKKWIACKQQCASYATKKEELEKDLKLLEAIK
jgi:hypothetical protein